MPKTDPKPETQPNSIVSRHEIAQILNVSRQRVEKLVGHPDFPAPICSIRSGQVPLWWRAQIVDFDKARKAPAAEGDDRKPAASPA